MSTSMSTGVENVSEVLSSALAGEYAAVYAYGLIGSHTSGAATTRSLRSLDAHRAQRDQLRSALIALGTTPEPPAPAYQTPTPVTSQASAAALAVTIEQRLVRSWSRVAAASATEARTTAARNASECATRAVSWGGPPQAFPG